MTEPIRVHLRVPGTAPMPDLMRLLRSIEAAGFDGAGILDSQMLSRDTFVVLGQAATNTSRLTLFPAVTNPFTRHPSVLARVAATADHVSGGRIELGMGAGWLEAEHTAFGFPFADAPTRAQLLRWLALRVTPSGAAATTRALPVRSTAPCWTPCTRTARCGFSTAPAASGR